MSPKVVIVIGASRGIGRQIAITLSQTSTVIVAAKSSSPESPPSKTPFPPDPNSPSSTIDTVVREITQAGGTAHPHPVDVRSPASIKSLIQNTLSKHSHIDAVIYNPGSIFWASVEETSLKRYQLMHEVNTQGLYCVVQEILPHFYGQGHGTLVVVSPPIYSRFPRGKTAYAMTKFAMTTLTMGLHHDFKRQNSKSGFEGVVCSIWPATGIVSAATEITRPGSSVELRKPSIFADAILAILEVPRREWGRVSGKTWLDEDYLRELKGMSDFSGYAVKQGVEVRRIMPRRLPILEVEEEDDEGDRMDSIQLRKQRAKL
jgi:NAD(P)-dependent dehydrogenase (short-subunit alcohol dehydrogenase family)